MNARIRLPDKLNELLKSELETAIHETAFCYEDNIIAKRYIIEKVPQIDIAAELGYERSTIGRRLKYILPLIERTAKRLYEN